MSPNLQIENMALQDGMKARVFFHGSKSDLFEVKRGVKRE